MTKKLIMSMQDFDFTSPFGEVIRLEDVSSIRAISLNNIVEDTFFVDIVDLNGNLRKNYTCSFACISYTMLMLFVESEKEDKTQINVSFESLMALLTKSRNLGYSEGANDEEESMLSEDALDELMKRETNALLN